MLPPLPFTKSLKTLVLDLDETLVHSEQYDPAKTFDKVIEVKFPQDGRPSVQLVGVNVRPYALTF
jgi:TFIIF-interacting CTD phosphatase-like protein